MYLYLYIYMYRYMYLYMYMCMYKYMCMYVLSTPLLPNVDVHILYSYMYLYLYRYMYKYMYKNIFKYALSNPPLRNAKCIWKRVSAHVHLHLRLHIHAIVCRKHSSLCIVFIKKKFWHLEIHEPFRGSKRFVGLMMSTSSMMSASL